MKNSLYAVTRATLSVCSIAIAMAGCGGSGSSGGGGGNNNPVPSVISLSPTSAPQNGAAFTLTVTGSGFISSSQVQWSGASLATTYAGATSITAQVPATDLAATGSFDIKVVNPAPGGGTSNAVAFTVGNPVPVLAAISPTSAAAGGPAFTLTASGSNFVSTSVIQWNGAALATTFVSATQLTAQVPASDLVSTASTTASVTVVNPAPDGGASVAAQFSIVQTSGAHLVTINLPANDIVWDAAHSRIYASLPSTATNGNSVVAIDPVTATVGTPVSVGSEPRPLALSSDNSLLYVGMDGSGQVKRLNLPALTIDSSLSLQLPLDPLYGQQVAYSLAVAPGTPTTFAAILGNYSWNSNTGGTVVYDNATPRTAALSDYYVEDSSLQWGADSSTLYAINGTTSGNDLFVMSVSGGGVTLAADYGYLVPTQYGKLHYDPTSKYLYVDGGRVVDPAAGNVIATFNTSPLAGYIAPQCALDIQNGVVFFLGQTTDQFNAAKGVLIESFDARTYQLLGTLSIANVTGHPIRLLRWGNAGLAFNMSGGTSSGNWLLQPPGGPIYLLDGNFVNSTKAVDFSTGTALTALPTLASISPEMAPVNSTDTTLTVTGANFSSAAVVTWNGTALTSSVTGATKITATIPAADLATPGTARVSVSDPTAGLSANTSLAFTIAPSTATSALSALNLAALDLAWDAKNARLMVPVWSADPRYPNSILAVDPATGTISKSATVASDPDLVRVTGDSSLVYTGFRTVNSVASLTLPNLGAGSSFWLGADPHTGPYYAFDLQPAPNAPQTLALAFAVNGSQPPETNGISIFDNGTARLNGTGRTIGFQNMQWTANGSRLYADDDAAQLYTYAVDSSGLTFVSRNLVLNSPSTSTLQDIHFDAGTGYLYSDNGWVIDPSNGSVIGDFKASGLAVPDSSLHRVFILGQLAAQSGTSNYTIQAFDQTAFTPVHSLTLNGIVGTPVAFVRWGASGLAMVTYNQNADAAHGPAGMLYIVSDSTLVSTHSVPATAADLERVQAFPKVRPRTLSLPPAASEDAQ